MAMQNEWVMDDTYFNSTRKKNINYIDNFIDILKHNFNKTAGYHRFILRLPILVKKAFKKMSHVVGVEVLQI